MTPDLSDDDLEAEEAHLMRKLGLRTQTELVRYAIAAGTVAPDV